MISLTYILSKLYDTIVFILQLEIWQNDLMGIVSKKCYTRSCKTHADYQHWFSIQHFLSCQNPNKSSRKDFWKNSWNEISIHEFCQWSYIIVLTEFSAQSKSSPSDVFSRKHCRVSNEHSKLVSSEISFKKLNIVNCQINCKFAWLWKPDCFVSEEYFQMCVFLVCISINILFKNAVHIYLDVHVAVLSTEI